MTTRECWQSLCNLGCCDFYANCVTPMASDSGCYSYSSYTYYDGYWWIYTLVAIALVLIVMALIAAQRRRRLNNLRT